MKPTMLAARLHGTGFDNLRIEEVPVPQPNDNQLLARVDAAGVCASNLKLIAQGSDHPFLNGWDLQKFPIQLGDEGCITIVAAGKNLRDRFPVGKRYCIQPAVDHPPINRRKRYRNHGEGMDKVAVGARDVQIQAQRWLARGGVLNLFGGLKKGEHVIDLDTLRCTTTTFASAVPAVARRPTLPRRCG